MKAVFFGDARFLGTSTKTSKKDGLRVLPGIQKPLIAHVPDLTFIYGINRPIRIYVTTKALVRDGDARRNALTVAEISFETPSDES